MHGGGGRAEPSDLLTTEDVLREAADATAAAAQGSWGEAVDVLPGQEGVLQRLCGEQGGRCPVALRPQASLTDRGLGVPLARATELQGGNYVLTQWGHAIAPFVR